MCRARHIRDAGNSWGLHSTVSRARRDGDDFMTIDRGTAHAMGAGAIAVRRSLKNPQRCANRGPARQKSRLIPLDLAAETADRNPAGAGEARARVKKIALITAIFPAGGRVVLKV